MCETAAYHRHDISDRARQIIDPKLPGDPGKAGRPAQDSRRFSNAVFRVLNTGTTWRDLPRTMATGAHLSPVPPLAQERGLGRTAGAVADD